MLTVLGINFLWLFAVFKMAEICERSERATENKKSVSEEILNFLDVGYLLLNLMKIPKPAAGENFGGLVVVKLLRDNLVESNLIQLEGTICSENRVFSQNYSVLKHWFLL